MSNARPGIFDNCLTIARWLLSPGCLLCAATCGEDGLCAECRSGLPRMPAARCPICAIANPTAQICGRCLVRRPHYDRVVVPFSYEFPATVLVQGLKYRGELACTRPLASALVDALEQEPYPDVLLAMPLAPARVAQRGFNQAVEISRFVAAEFGVEVSHDLCRRIQEGVPQATLPWKQRAKNIRDAFACDADLTGKRVAIVDDVLTTGATLSELAQTLKRQGALEVTGWIVARTPAPGEA